MADERFLVTGALGCIGAWAVKRLESGGGGGAEQRSAFHH